MKTDLKTKMVLGYRREAAFSLTHTRPDHMMPTSEELDYLLGVDTIEDLLAQSKNNKIADRLFSSLTVSHDWFHAFMPSLNWWITLSDLALEGRNPIGDFECGPNPNFCDYRNDISQCLVKTLNAYEPAHRKTSPYSADWGIFGPEIIALMKSYRLYTKQVAALVKEVWPDLEL